MRILNEYPTHHYFETYQRDESIYCPSCGSKGVWVSDGADYYQGQEHICTNCNTSFSLPSCSEMTEPRELKIIEQLVNGETYKPTTRKGN